MYFNYQFVVLLTQILQLYHAIPAKLAIAHKKHFLTTSYVSDAMKALADDAKKAGVIIINECGVDPGSDHMSAQKIIDEAHQDGGLVRTAADPPPPAYSFLQVTYFTSYCGGLPHPKDNDNPLGYKFSWAPRGVLLATRNDAIFLR